MPEMRVRSVQVTCRLLVVKSKRLNVYNRLFPQGQKPWDVSF